MMTALLDLIPLIAFFITAKKVSIIAAAAAFLIGTLIVYGIHLVHQKGRLSRQQWTILILTVLFCGATLLLHDDLYLRWKSPIISLVFSLALFISALIHKPIMQNFGQSILKLSPQGWEKLTHLWALYFLLMAGLHYWFGFYQPDDVWISFKTWGQLIIMFIFLIAQGIALRHHLVDTQ